MEATQLRFHFRTPQELESNARGKSDQVRVRVRKLTGNRKPQLNIILGADILWMLDWDLDTRVRVDIDPQKGAIRLVEAPNGRGRGFVRYAASHRALLLTLALDIATLRNTAVTTVPYYIEKDNSHLIIHPVEALRGCRRR